MQARAAPAPSARPPRRQRHQDHLRRARTAAPEGFAPVTMETPRAAARPARGRQAPHRLKGQPQAGTADHGRPQARRPQGRGPRAGDVAPPPSAAPVGAAPRGNRRRPSSAHGRYASRHTRHEPSRRRSRAMPPRRGRQAALCRARRRALWPTSASASSARCPRRLLARRPARRTRSTRADADRRRRRLSADTEAEGHPLERVRRPAAGGGGDRPARATPASRPTRSRWRRCRCSWPARRCWPSLPSWGALVRGAAIIELSYVLDCADGQLARLQGNVVARRRAPRLPDGRAQGVRAGGRGRRSPLAPARRSALAARGAGRAWPSWRPRSA